MKYGLLAVLGASVLGAATPETRLMRYPDISRDSVVFVYAGDLWVSQRAGGQARRLTSHPGDELYPKFSPDGKWIAFTGEYDGNADVYVIPAEGGEPRRLTFHPATDLVLGWTPDGKKILFRSNRANTAGPTTRLFLVSPDGGLPEMLPVPRASLTSFSEDGEHIAYNTTSQEFRTWKRYRGGWTNYISLYDLKNNKYDEIPRSGAMDMFPMWHGNSIYFISDRTGVMNLFRYDLPSKKTSKLTDYKEYDVKWPSLGADAIVFENGGLLYAYDLANGKTNKVSISVAGEDTFTRPVIENVGTQIRGAAISPTGLRAVFEARGDIFTVPAEKGAIRNLTGSSGSHERDPAWSPDGKWITYLSDRSGEWEIYIRPQKGGDEVRITSDGNCYRDAPVWSPDSKKLAYWDEKLRLYYVDLDKKQPVLADRADYRNSGYINWSPDSRWLAYAKEQDNLFPALYLYSLDRNTATRVTDGFYFNSRPVFDPAGKYLYFLSSRFYYPSAGALDTTYNYYDMFGIFAVTLKRDTASPFAPESDDEKDGAQKADEPKKLEEPKKDEAKTEEVKPIEIDLEGLGDRIVQVPIPAGIYDGLEVRKDKIFYTASSIESTQEGRPGPHVTSNVLHLFDVKKRKDEVLLSGVSEFYLDKEGSKLLYKAGDSWGIVDAAPGKAKTTEGKLDLATLEIRIDPREEWKEIFHEAWRIERDFYWDPDMGGLNWKKIQDRYESLLPWVAHRSDLNYLIGEMIAELSTSHTYVSGGEMPDRKRVGVGLLGVDFARGEPFYKIAKIYKGENWVESTRSPLTEPGLKVKEGDYLIAVNGELTKAPAEPYSYFQNLNNKVVVLRINDKPSEEGAWEISVKTIGSEAGLRYFNWVESRRELVSKATNGRVAYMHVPDTSIAGLIMFDKYLAGQVGKQALIVDERYNAGGWIPSFYTEKLGRELLYWVSSREGKDEPWPPVGIYGPKVMLVNELSGSGGDSFPWFFKREKLGSIVGTRTWGGLVGISRSIPMMDGGSVTAPETGFWATTAAGTSEWVVENHGVDPDYVIDQRPDLEVAGHDPQLEKAIELIKAALDKMPPPPGRPKYPNKQQPFTTPDNARK
jgi:tricorn protease